MLLGRQEGRETFRAAYFLRLFFETRKKCPGKGPAGCQRTCCCAANGAGRRFEVNYCLTLPSETKRKSPGKGSAGGQRTRCWAAKGAGKGLGATYCLTLLSETRKKSPGKRPVGGQGRRETFRVSIRPNVAFKPEENLQKSARQVAKGHAAGPPTVPGNV